MPAARNLSVPAALVLALAARSAAFSQQKLKFAQVYEMREPYHTAALWAAGEIAKRTGNRYTVDVFPASSLGNETQINQSLTLATVDMIYTGQLFAGRSHGPISIGGAPFMFRDFDHWKKYADSALFRELAAGYQKASGGNTVVAITYYGNRQTTANKARNRPAGEFAKRGKTVVKVDRRPFMEAVQKYYQSGKLPDGNALPWPRETYDRLQAIR